MIGEVMRQGFLTEYRAGLRGKYSSEITARSWADARRVARGRGIGEVVIGEGRLHSTRPASAILRARKAGLAEKLHALCWLARLALASKVATGADFFDDETGIIHQLAHLYGDLRDDPKESKTAVLQALSKRAATIERRVPGYLA